MSWQTNKNLLFLFKHMYICRGMNFSFSQEGEDLVLDNYFDFKRKGFYVDFGAYHPYMYSNTLRFYARGWNGLNIDAMPGSMKAFNRIRPRDINVECGVSDREGEMTYYQFNEPGLNSFDESVIKPCEESGYKYIGKTNVIVKTPMQILDEYVPEGKDIDFMDIDIEGYDEIVVDSIDWEKYKPTIVMIEKKLDNRNSALVVNKTLVESGYSLFGCTGRTAIYERAQMEKS